MDKKQHILLVVFLLFFTLACAWGSADANQTPPSTPIQALSTPTPENPGLAPRPVDLATKDVTYALLGHASQKLDIYLPEENPKDAPVMIFVHGGGWQIGDKTRTQFKDDVFNETGYIFISVNYRLHHDATWKEMAADIALSIAWVHEHISSYGGDPDRIFLMGHSAGAHLVSLIATDERYLTNVLLDLVNLSGVVSLDTRAYDISALSTYGTSLPRAYATIFGDDPNEWQAASPITFVAAGKNIPPLALAWTGGNSGNNAFARETATRAFAEALDAENIPILLVDASDKTHAEINRQFGEPDDDFTKEIMNWLEKLR